MSINEVPHTPKPTSGGILEKMVMHGVAQSQPKRAKKVLVADHLYLDDNNRVVGTFGEWKGMKQSLVNPVESVPGATKRVRVRRTWDEGGEPNFYDPITKKVGWD